MKALHFKAQEHEADCGIDAAQHLDLAQERTGTFYLQWFCDTEIRRHVRPRSGHFSGLRRTFPAPNGL